MSETNLTPKDFPLARAVLDYFPSALLEVSRVSVVANEQHNPGEEVHWAREKSTDHADALLRHLIRRGTHDADGLLHSAKVAWRALALLQEELEAAGAEAGRASRWTRKERERVLVDSYKAGSEARSDEGFDEGSVSDEEWLEGFREHARKAFERGSKRFLTYDFGSAETSGTEIDGYVTYCWLCQCAHEDPCSEADELHARGWTPAPSGDAREMET